MTGTAETATTVKFKKAQKAGLPEVFVRFNMPKERGLNDSELLLEANGVIEGYWTGERVSTKFKTPEITLNSLDGSKTYVVKKAGNLMKQLEFKGINVGDPVQITYLGKVVNAKTGAGPFHTFVVAGEETGDVA